MSSVNAVNWKCFFSYSWSVVSAAISGWEHSLMWPKRIWSWAKTCTRQTESNECLLKVKAGETATFIFATVILQPDDSHKTTPVSILKQLRCPVVCCAHVKRAQKDRPNWAICPYTLHIRQKNLWSSITALLERRETGGVQHIAATYCRNTIT